MSSTDPIGDDLKSNPIGAHRVRFERQAKKRFPRVFSLFLSTHDHLNLKVIYLFPKKNPQVGGACVNVIHPVFRLYCTVSISSQNSRGPVINIISSDTYGKVINATQSLIPRQPSCPHHTPIKQPHYCYKRCLVTRPNRYAPLD